MSGTVYIPVLYDRDMDNPCIKQTVCIVLNTFQHGKYFVAYAFEC